MIINAYVMMWKNYANFSGKTNIPGFWWAILADLVIGWVLGFIPFVGMVYALAVIIPTIAIAVRRMHDAGLHWALLFLNCIPILGQIACVILLCQPSKNPNVIDIDSL